MEIHALQCVETKDEHLNLHTIQCIVSVAIGLDDNTQNILHHLCSHILLNQFLQTIHFVDALDQPIHVALSLGGKAGQSSLHALQCPHIFLELINGRGQNIVLVVQLVDVTTHFVGLTTKSTQFTDLALLVGSVWCHSSRQSGGCPSYWTTCKRHGRRASTNSCYCNNIHDSRLDTSDGTISLFTFDGPITILLVSTNTADELLDLEQHPKASTTTSSCYGCCCLHLASSGSGKRESLEAIEQQAINLAALGRRHARYA
mmetsp:Transcript_10321/g.17333  ORF Transcript_10321/g.17333 Transcript_10321/m.17333 type:complete len:259 (-) Transcript_10321:17-793(-)